MNANTLAKIREECEKIENDSGFGVVTLKIKNKTVYLIEATHSTQIEATHSTQYFTLTEQTKLDNYPKE